MRRGTIHSYDGQKRTGIITSDDGDRELSFVYPGSTILTMYEPGDRVEYEISWRKGINVEIYHPVDLYKDIYRCSRCRRYLRLVEVEQRVEDGDWGDGIITYCKKCGAQASGTGRLTDALSQYREGTMPEEDAAEFAKALEDRSLLPALLNRLFKFH